MKKLPENYIKQFKKIDKDLDKLKDMIKETIEMWQELVDKDCK